MFAHRPFADRIGVATFQLSPASILNSDFNRAHLGSATGIGYGNLRELCDRTLEIVRRPGRRYLYLYWPELDNIGHRSGIWSQEAGDHLQTLDRMFHSLCQGLQGTDTLLLVSADHGQVDSTPDQTLILEDYPSLQESLVMPLCGEPRSAYCYLRPGRERCFDETVTSLFQGLATAYPSSVPIEQNWFGLGVPHPRLGERVGDRVLLLHRRAAIWDWLPQEKPYRMIGVHGGLSGEELWVPLISATC